nr:ArdC-like ssDNA-binding domain-containing protein [Pedobacter panaciterrae]
MSNYKPFDQQVADLLIKRLESGISPFQRDDAGHATNFQTPVNASTGKNYRGMNALWLSMQPYDDARWMTLNQANKLQIKIPRGSTGTLLNVVKTSESFAMLDDSGKRMKDESGKVKYQTIQLERPMEETHWVFNAEQLELGSPIRSQTGTEDGIERLEKLVAATEVKLPANGDFKSVSDYNAALIQELLHWTDHPDRLNREVSVNPGMPGYAAESLRAGIATLLLGAEIGIETDAPEHYEKFIPEWIALLKANPTELRNAAQDGQKIADFILETELKLGLRKEAKQKPSPLGLNAGDQIKYNETSYKVLEHLKGDKLKIEDVNTGAKLAIAPTDGLYKSLVQAKYRNPERRISAVAEQSQESKMSVAETEQQLNGNNRKR